MNLSLFPDTDAACLAVPVIPVIDYTVRALCASPYPGHKKGCPNIGKCDRCPPAAPLFDQHFDMSQPFFAVINEFDLAGHVERMRERNQAWSDAQLRCCLYWQPTARKQLESRILSVLTHPQFRDYSFTGCPEGMGMNVTETLLQAGIELEWPPVQVVRQVAVIGIRR